MFYLVIIVNLVFAKTYFHCIGAWDPSIRIEPPALLPADKKHKQKLPEKFEEVTTDFSYLS